MASDSEGDSRYDLDGSQQVEMADLLSDLGYSSEILEKFKQEKIYIPTISLLTDQEMMDLGIKTVGERAMLRKQCREFEQSKKVSNEISRIMGPTSSNLRYNLSSRSLTSSHGPIQIARKPKRKSKLRIAEELHGVPKRRLSTAYFQKKIVVFNFMGPNPPISFSRCEKNICLTGLLPSISLEASESTVRKEICEVIHSCSSHDLSNIDPQDFEFISMTGKHAGIPQCKNGFQWNGRAVKELAGAGSIYIRLLKDGANPHSDDDLLPPGPCWGSSNSQASDAVLPNDVLVEQIANDESGSLADCNEDDDNNFVDLVSDEEPGFTTESSSANTVIQIDIGSNASISANIPANSGGNSVTSTANIPADSDNLFASTANSCNSVTSSANIPANSGGNSVTSTANIPANSGNLVAGTTTVQI